MILLLGGFPGVGKTLVCRRLVKELGFKSLEIGQTLRRLVGASAFLDTDNPRAPDRFESKVRDMITDAVREYCIEDFNLVIDSTPRTVDQVRFLITSIPSGTAIGLWVYANTTIRTNRLSLRGRDSYKLATTATYEPELAAWAALTGRMACDAFDNARSWEDYDARATVSATILSTWSRRGTPGVVYGGCLSAGSVDNIPDGGGGTGGSTAGPE